MATTTKRLGLLKPELTDPADITQMNRNWDIIDDKLSNIQVTSEVPSDSDFWIDPDDVSAEEAHLTDMNNPHNVTIEQIGAAPSGFGLGTSPKFITDANDAILPGFYAPNGVSCANIPSEWQFLYGTIIVSQGASFIEQLFLASNLMAKRTCDPHGSGWGEWEYINPPINPGIEYRTTERWSGHVVYCKRIDIGALPNTSQTEIAHGLNATYIVRWEAVNSFGSALPFVYMSNRIEIGCDKNNIYVTTTADYSYTTAYITIYYTKT